MANQWFRMYAEFSTDPKVQMLSETDQRRLVMILCLRCNGNVTLHDEEVTFLLRISNEEWQKSKSVFISKNFINEANEVLNWDKRQFASDTSKNRVAAYRERKKIEGNADVTLHKQKCNAVDTEQIQNRTDISTSLRSVDKPSKRKTQLPENFNPAGSSVDTLTNAGISVQEELQKFTDYCRSNGTLALDWQAKFRTWASNAVEWKKPNRKPSQSNHHDKRAEFSNQLWGNHGANRPNERVVASVEIESDRARIPELVAVIR